ncbi:hypothetical protein IKD67_03240 [Candidatus Saccharibacteria bacterium]|nr:hypothetical protein [Candidatus Saccharibacteria bacterium]
MEKDETYQAHDSNENTLRVDLLEEMPSFEKHMLQNDSEDRGDAPKNKEGLGHETPKELRERFLSDRYQFNNYENIDFYSCHSIVDSYANDKKWRLDKLLEYNANHEMPEYSVDLLQELVDINEDESKTMKLLVGDWNPRTIADKYGSQVEKFGVSLADINILLRFVDDDKYGNVNRQYLKFCRNLPGIIERYFSDETPEEEKKTMGTIINKTAYYYCDNTDEEFDYNYKKTILSEKETDFIVDKIEEALAKQEKTLEDICDVRPSSATSTESIFVDPFFSSKLGDAMLNGIWMIFETKNYPYISDDIMSMLRKIESRITDQSKTRVKPLNSEN